MQNNLLFSLILNISLLVLMATVLTELRPLRLMIKRQERSVYNQLFLGLIFGLLSISCTYTGLSFEGAVVNTRVVSTLAAGLVGGPVSGVCAGLMSGVHRYFYNPSGFTSFACGIGTFGFGVFGAVSYRLFSRRGRRTLDLILLTIAAELMQAALILLLSKPFSAALALEKAILLPKMIVNSVGLVAFMRILDRLNRDLTIELVEQRAVALLIAQECLPYLRKGIRNREGLQRAVDIVREKLPHFQVALTDRTQVLAASGCDLLATPLPIAAREAMAQQETVVMEVSKGRRSAMLSAPLVTDEHVIGSLLLIAPTGPNLVLDADVKTLESLAQFFSVMLELGETERQITLRKQAEFRALQSQINPHFLFNALNTISALCMTDPDRACQTILILANYFRQTLTINEPFVPLEQEISNVDNYLMLTEARFEGALHVECELPDDLRAAPAAAHSAAHRGKCRAAWLRRRGRPARGHQHPSGRQARLYPRERPGPRLPAGGAQKARRPQRPDLHGPFQREKTPAQHLRRAVRLSYRQQRQGLDRVVLAAAHPAGNAGR